VSRSCQHNNITLPPCKCTPLALGWLPRNTLVRAWQAYIISCVFHSSIEPMVMNNARWLFGNLLLLTTNEYANACWKTHRWINKYLWLTLISYKEMSVGHCNGTCSMYPNYNNQLSSKTLVNIFSNWACKHYGLITKVKCVNTTCQTNRHCHCS